VDGWEFLQDPFKITCFTFALSHHYIEFCTR
jgi:hypothetical protein